MSIRVTRKVMKSTRTLVGVLMAASALAGCSTFGMAGGTDGVVTGSANYAGSSNLNQPMPSALPSGTQVAEGPYTPPENIGSGGPGYNPSQQYPGSMASAPQTSAIQSQDLPSLSSSPSNRNTQTMSAQPNLAPVPVGLKTASLGSTPRLDERASGLSVVPKGTYTHVIQSGESLYTIARHYNVTAQSIVQASGLSSPDKIFVGQRVVIPGRPDLLAAMDGHEATAIDARLPTDSSVPKLAETHAEPVKVATQVASLGPNDAPVRRASEIVVPEPQSLRPRPPVQQPASATISRNKATTPAAAPAAVRKEASIAPSTHQAPLQEPAMSGADKFRWPVSGKIVVSFAASKGTGINIAAPNGTPVRASENGTVIYVGNGVEGYGNLVLIRHANNYVSAYANLGSVGVTKGATVSRGDAIGTIGMTGSVTSPQVHFELRKGATPVDPVPLLAG